MPNAGEPAFRLERTEPETTGWGAENSQHQLKCLTAKDERLPESVSPQCFAPGLLSPLCPARGGGVFGRQPGTRRCGRKTARVFRIAEGVVTVKHRLRSALHCLRCKGLAESCPFQSTPAGFRGRWHFKTGGILLLLAFDQQLLDLAIRLEIHRDPQARTPGKFDPVGSEGHAAAQGRVVECCAIDSAQRRKARLKIA